MKTRNIAPTALLAFAALGAAAVARADERIVAHVPFSFIVGTTELPPGDYVVTEDFSENQGVLRIESVNGQRNLYALSIVADEPRPSQSELVFEKFDNRYFLSRVAGEGGLSREIPLTPKIMQSEIVRIQATGASAATAPQ
jgi:hypothetical protein